jgi:hypothetical protein
MKIFFIHICKIFVIMVVIDSKNKLFIKNHPMIKLCTVQEDLLNNMSVKA